MPLPPGNGASAGTVLVDGFWAAEWAITRDQGEAVLEVRPFTRLDPGQLGAVTAESRRLPSFRRPHRRRGARDPHHQPGSGVTETEL